MEKTRHMLKNEKILFKADPPIKQEFLFLDSPIASTFHSIKSLSLGFGFGFLFPPKESASSSIF